MPEETKPETPVAPAKVELPKADFFGGNKMMKFAEQSGFFKSSDDDEATPSPIPQKKETPCPQGSPCAEKKETAPVKKSNESEERERQLAERERILNERDAQYEAISGPLNKLLDRFDAGDFNQPTKPKDEKDQTEEDLDLDLVAPGLKKIILEQKQSIQNLQGIVARFGESSKEAELQRAKMAMESSFIDARKENPFDDVFVEDKSFPKLSEDLYAGLVSVLVKRDQNSGKPLKSMAGYMREAARGMKTLQDKLKGGVTSSEAPTSKTILEKYPDIANEIGQQAIADYLNNQRSAPVAKSGSAETKSVDRGNGNRKFKGLDDALSAASNDPLMDSAMAEFMIGAPKT